MNDFERDNAWQRGIRDTILAPGFYGRYAFDGRYVLVDKGRLASVLQKRYAVDTIVQLPGGVAACVEEKIVRWPGRKYTAVTLETDSCTKPGRESPGWMQYGRADYLLYCFEMEAGGWLDCLLMEFATLQKWFWRHIDRFKTFGPLKTLNGTKGRVVPISDIRAAVPTRRFYVAECFCIDKDTGDMVGASYGANPTFTGTIRDRR